VEAVMIVTPNELHSRAVTTALQSGKHVFFEPPLGLNSDEISSALRVMAASPLVIQADLELRHVPVLKAVRKKVADGLLGDLHTAKVRLWCDWGYGGGKWLDEVERQGFWLWLSCWYLDVLDAVWGVAPVRVSVVGGQAMNRSLTDHGWATLTYPGGRIGCFEFSLVAMGGQETSLAIQGTAGELHADLWSGACRWRHRGGKWIEETIPCAQPPHGFAGMHESIASFLAAIAKSAPVKANLAIVRRIHQAALACAASEAEQRDVVVVPL
jgi:predicted dehydrogenase